MLDLETVNVMELKDALPGACFHGEVWVKCPYCGKATELGYFPQKNMDIL